MYHSYLKFPEQIHKWCLLSMLDLCWKGWLTVLKIELCYQTPIKYFTTMRFFLVRRPDVCISSTMTFSWEPQNTGIFLNSNVWKQWFIASLIFAYLCNGLISSITIFLFSSCISTNYGLSDLKPCYLHRKNLW